MFGAGPQKATSPHIVLVNRIAAARRTGTVRAALLGGASVLALATAALPSAALAQDQTINTTTAGPVAANGSAITVTGAGAITGAANGITYGAITTLSNQGVISGTSQGVAGNGSIGTLSNQGTIFGAAAGIANAGSIGTLTNSGAISGGGSATGISNAGTIATLTNSGTIAGPSAGIQNSGGIGTLGNAARGLVAGGAFGIYNAAGIGTLSNAGRISATSTAISNSGSIGSLTNSGTISGASYAINSTGSIGAITNTGVIDGNIAISGQSGIEIIGGTGSVFGTLTGGTITESSGIHLVKFVDNIRLDDDIDGFANNTGFLQVANSHTITGTFNQGLLSVLDIQAGGTAAGDYGSLTATGVARFAYGLAFDLIDGFTLTAGDDFNIFNFASSTGDFSSFAFDGISCSAGGNDVWSCGAWTFTEAFQGGTQLWLDVSAEPVPEPAALGLFGSGLAALGLLRRRRA